MATEKNITRPGKENIEAYIPAADIYETADLYSLKLEMPGVRKEDLDILLDKNELKISGKNSVTDNAEDLKYHDFDLCNFQRSFRIGNDIDRNQIDAILENGVLSLILHKSEEVKPKKILINNA